MRAIVVTLIGLTVCISACSSHRSPTVAWVDYVDACTERIKTELPLCSAFPFPPSEKSRGEAIGAMIGVAQDVGEILAPLVIPALAAKGVVQ